MTQSGFSNIDLAHSTVTLSRPSAQADGNDFIEVTVQARRANGTPVPGLTVMLHVDLSDVSQPAGPTDANGQATARVTSLNAGTHSATAVVSQQGLSYTLPAQAVLMFYNQEIAAGAPGTVTVTGGGTIHFTSTDPCATLPPDYTFASSDNGIKIFVAGIVLRTPGLQTVTATNLATGQIVFQQVYWVTGSAVTVATATSFGMVLPSTVTAGQAIDVTLQALDNQGAIVSSYVGAVGISLSDSRATGPAAVVFNANDQGIQIFAVTFITAGWQTLNAADLLNPALVSGPQAVQVTAGDAALAQVTSASDAWVAGQGSAVTVSVQDAFGNLVTGFTGAVRLTSSDPTATLPSIYTFTPGDAGKHTFSGIALTIAGTQTLSAVESGGGATLGTIAVSVAAAAPETFVVQGSPTSVDGAQIVALTVTAVDSYGNTASNYTGGVTLTTDDPQASLPGTVSFTASDAGVRSNLGVVLRTAGARHVTATDVNNPVLTGTSLAFQVSATAATTLSLTGVPSTWTAGQPVAITVIARDPYGNVATGYNGTVGFSASDAQAVLPGHYAFTPADAGAHTFAVTLTTAGENRSVTVTDESSGTLQVSAANLSVVPAAAARLQVTGPVQAAAGVGISVTVTAYDAWNNLVTGYAGTVQFTSSDAHATVPATYTFGAVDAGTKNFSVTLATAGAQTVTASDAAQSTVHGSSPAITVTPAAAVALVVSGITAGTAGSVSGVILQAFDAYGNIATGYRGTVHFTSSDSQATLPIDYSFVGGDAGQKTFPNSVTLRTAGTQSVTAVDFAQSSITGRQSNLVVTAAGAASLILSGVGATAVAGQVFTITLSAQDSFGNTAVGYTGSVSLTSSDAQAALPGSYTFTTSDQGTRALGAATLKTSGPQSLTATDTSSPGVHGNANTMVSAAAASGVQISGMPSTVVSAQIVALTVAVRDAYGNLATGYTGAMHLGSSDSTAVLPSNYTYTTSDAGQHAFSVALKAAGNQNVTATDTASPGLQATVSTTVTSSGAANLVVSGLPASLTAGTAGSITVQVVDSSNNTVTSYTGTVLFSSSDVQATLPAVYTFQASDNGVHTFTSVILKTAGVQSITATDAGTHITGQQGGIAVKAGSAQLLQLTGLTAGTVGVPQSITVSAMDSYDNIATNYGGTVHFASDDSNAALPIDLTFGAGDQGVHSFASGVTFHTAGSRTVTVTDTSMGSVRGSQTGLVIAAGPAVSLALSGLTGGPAPVAGTLSVTAYDTYGNVATNYTGTVHFQSTDSQAVLPANYRFAALDAGQRSFGITLETAGVQSVTASDTLTGSITGTQSGVAVTGGAATHLGVICSTTLTAGNAADLTVTAFDAFNNVASGYSGTVQVQSTDSNASLPPNTAFTSADAGVHTFVRGVTFTAAGTQSLTVTDTASSGISGRETGITVAAAAARRLQLTGLASAVAGTPQTLTVRAYDAYNNVATGYTGTVRVQSSDANALLPGATTFTGADAGAHTFVSSITLLTAGTQSVSASDTLTGSITGSQTGLVIAAAGASHLLVSGTPLTLAAGQSASLRITALDAYNNVATGYLGTVTFQSTDANAILPGLATFVVADAGVKTFSNAIEFVNGGNQTVTVTDVAKSSITGNVTFQSTAACNGAGMYGAASQASVGTNPYGVAVGDFNGDGKLDVAAANGGSNNISILLGHDDGTFTTALNSPVGTNPREVAVGDFNGDGRLDVVAANTGGNTISILLGQGNGTFATAINSSVGSGPVGVAVGDFNSDGKLDVVAANDNISTVSILLGQGNGAFAAAVNLPVGTYPNGVAVGDFNGDGKPDVVAANNGSNNISVLLGQGNGTFSAAVTQPVGTQPRGVAVGDFNGDGKLDVVAANWGSNNVSILLGQGNGTFSAAVNDPVGTNPERVTVGDFNGDHKLDVVATNDGNNSISILLGQGDGTFTTAVNTPVGSNPFGVAVGDFNRDGKLDVVEANTSDGSIGILLGRGNGTFPAAVSYSVGTYPYGVALGDFNGDGKPDLATANEGSNNVSILLDQGNGTFSAAVNYNVGASPTGAAVGDFNGDGKLDVAAANDGGNNVSILLGQGNGTFGVAVNFAVGGGSEPRKLGVGDFNGDGKLDLATANYGSNNVGILLGQGNGAFTAAVNYVVGAQPFGVAVGDFNGDGKLDLAVANNGSSNVSVLLGQGNGTFTAAVNYTVGLYPFGVAVGDFNGDGKPDLATANNGTSNVSVLLGQGNGTFLAPVNYNVGLAPWGVAVGDFNGDGKPDLTVANAASNSISVLLGQGNGTFVAALNYAVGTDPYEVVVGDFNGDGKLDLAVTNFISNDVSILLYSGCL